MFSLKSIHSESLALTLLVVALVISAAVNAGPIIEAFVQRATAGLR